MMQRVANLSSRLDPGLSREFIEKNRRSMTEFVQHLASPSPEAASSDRFETPLSGMPDPALILCQCDHVNRWAKSKCTACGRILSHVHERPDVTLEDDTRTVLTWLRRIVNPLLQATAAQAPQELQLPFNAKEIFLDASAHLHLREVFGANVPPHLPAVGSGVGGGGRGPSRHQPSPVEKFEDMLTRQDMLLLRLLISVAPEAHLELVASACMLFAVSRGCGLVLAQIQLLQLARLAGGIDDMLEIFATEPDPRLEHSALVLACEYLPPPLPSFIRSNSRLLLPFPASPSPLQAEVEKRDQHHDSLLHVPCHAPQRCWRRWCTLAPCTPDIGRTPASQARLWCSPTPSPRWGTGYGGLSQ